MIDFITVLMLLMQMGTCAGIGFIILIFLIVLVAKAVRS